LPVLDILFLGIPVAVLAYYIRHQGCLAWDYRWRSRAEAPGYYWFSVAAWSSAILFIGWMDLEEYVFHA
jgi:hypothetical protein